ncbi:hypothetical protein ACFO5R_16020 [Halosolutus amylolyticus]|uniref:DUF7979 domain-containing protein n=1 Tax=Halosolutus amylolyticus TaxID=2932267 RepID=A0ABD5PSL1_9EURY|nr:hypothetical protein [Halosolutus amylolyticus]
MSQHVTAEPVDDVPADSTVCHYDELGEAAKELFPDLVGESGPDDDFDAVDEDAADGLQRCDFVKYTDYYGISVN